MRSLLLFLILSITLPLTAQRTTLLDKDGERMRGTAIALGRNSALGETRAAVRNPDWWNGLDTLGINTVRLCWVDPWYDFHPFGPTWTVDQVLPWIDDAVANAEAAGLNIVINYHGLEEYQKTGGFGKMSEFWRKVAPRYADNDLVYYELANEQSFEQDDYLLPAFQDTTRRIYEMVHDLAPERHILLFSFNSMNHNMKAIVDAYDWVDYDYTTVAFHMYGWHQVDPRVGQRNLERLMAEYPVFCTEWDVRQEFLYVSRFYGQDIMAQPLEEMGVSWLDWRDWGDASNDQYTDFIIPDAMAQGYWWLNSVSTTGPLANSVSISAYPNPVAEVLHLNVPVELQGSASTVSIYNAAGQLLRRETVTAGGEVIRLRVSDLPKGTYAARVDGRDHWGAVRFVR